MNDFGFIRSHDGRFKEWRCHWNESEGFENAYFLSDYVFRKATR